MGLTMATELSGDSNAEQSAIYPMLSACEGPRALRGGERPPIRLVCVCRSIRRRFEGDSDAVPWSAGLFRTISGLEWVLDGKLLSVDDDAGSGGWLGSGTECSEGARTFMSACTPKVLCCLTFAGLSRLAFSVCTPTALCVLLFTGPFSLASRAA